MRKCSSNRRMGVSLVNSLPRIFCTMPGWWMARTDAGDHRMNAAARECRRPQSQADRDVREGVMNAQQTSAGSTPREMRPRPRGRWPKHELRVKERDQSTAPRSSTIAIEQDTSTLIDVGTLPTSTRRRRGERDVSRHPDTPPRSTGPRAFSAAKNHAGATSRRPQPPRGGAGPRD